MSNSELSSRSKYLLFLLIFLSGATALTYEVAWHRYLHILFGAQAQATATILAVFLGGLGLGYEVFGRLSRNSKLNGIKSYALIELGIGVWAFLFPLLFKVLFPLTGKLYAVFGVDNYVIDLVVSCL